MTEMYEVFRFIDQGTRCRQSLDCVEGTLLAYYLRDNPEVEKAVLFEWFRQIGKSLEQFRRCRGGKGYRYLNPYSIIVTEEERICLLDLDSPENESVLKMMQHRAVRNHFLKQVPAQTTGGFGPVDLFGYGKTMQFMLAYTTLSPGLTRMEEIKLSRIIDRCIGNRKKGYDDVRKILKDLPEIRKTAVFQGRTFGLALLCSLILILGGFLLYSYVAVGRKNAEKTENGQKTDSILKEEDAQILLPDKEAEQPEEQRLLEEYADDVSEGLEERLLENTSEGNKEVLLLGQELERDTLRCLAAAYEREEKTEKAISAYGRLLEIEEREDLIESAGIRRMRLEVAQRQYAAALLTGEKVLEKVGESDRVRAIMEECRTEREMEEGIENEKNG